MFLEVRIVVPMTKWYRYTIVKSVIDKLTKHISCRVLDGKPDYKLFVPTFFPRKCKSNVASFCRQSFVLTTLTCSILSLYCYPETR